MSNRRRRLRPWLAAALSLGLAGGWWLGSAPCLAAGEPAAAVAGAGGDLVPCEPEHIPATLIRTEKSVMLGVPPRKQAAGHPPEGWCGETAIQEAMLLCGVFFPQKMINAAGRPQHPDLYSGDVPVALRNLGMEIRVWPDGTPRPDLDGFLAWVRGHVDAGVPVLCGVKINPTQHPEWGLDHFVLAVGYIGDGLVMNNTWGHRETRTTKQLASTSEKGFAFENRYQAYYGIAIVGPADRGEGFTPARLFVQKETNDQMAVMLKCEGLKRGTRYAIYRLSAYDQESPKPVHVFRATGPVAGFRDLIDKRGPAIYRCRELSGGQR